MERSPWALEVKVTGKQGLGNTNGTSPVKGGLLGTRPAPEGQRLMEALSPGDSLLFLGTPPLRGKDLPVATKLLGAPARSRAPGRQQACASHVVLRFEMASP